MNQSFHEKLERLQHSYESFIRQKNVEMNEDHGIYSRYKHPVLTAAHVPLSWKFDLNENSNPNLLQRIGFNAVFNAGAVYFNGKYVLVARVEAANRKSFFAAAESENGIDGFEFHSEPINIPLTDDPDVNLYDMRVTAHEDGYLYGVFCTERKDPEAPEGDHSSAIAQAGIVRTKDLKNWERLPDLITPSAQQRNVVLHPEFVNSQYMFYTRPQDGFINAGKGGGIGYGFCDNIEKAVIKEEFILDPRQYHTVSELKNGLGPAPIKTEEGWLHLAHGVRNTAAGLRYVLYLFLTSLEDVTRVTHKPGGYFMAPEGIERIGDVSNVLFANGWIVNGDDVYIYYASSDTRMHVATSTVEQLLDYVKNSPAEVYTSQQTVKDIQTLIRKNNQQVKV
ncbi:glycoside hydrolase family 130 protein [Gynurincola endophyticus]|jgi:4-O-beta-D-mannosyl-D-glucose phosphorylase|uniref:glycoside hydrolase family 130 protein n=1 Tax=Gynurincola endophyticus TaxID=2479004 RepID=UPI000F8D0B5D|nr:glycosidase [Gynurincola endophyticus]